MSAQHQQHLNQRELAKRWGVTADQIKTAHRKVGKMTRDIAADLGKKR